MHTNETLMGKTLKVAMETAEHCLFEIFKICKILLTLFFNSIQIKETQTKRTLKAAFNNGFSKIFKFVEIVKVVTTIFQFFTK